MTDLNAEQNKLIDTLRTEILKLADKVGVFPNKLTVNKKTFDEIGLSKEELSELLGIANIEVKANDTTKKKLDDHTVQEYIKYRATMDCAFLRVELYGKDWEGINSEEEFLEHFNMSKNSRQALYVYRQIKGFKEAAEKEKHKFGKKLIEIANTGLYKRAQGMEITVQKLSKDGDAIDCIEELPPDTKACELIHKIFGNLTDKMEIEHTLNMQAKWKEAADSLDKNDESGGEPVNADTD